MQEGAVASIEPRWGREESTPSSSELGPSRSGGTWGREESLEAAFPHPTDMPKLHRKKKSIVDHASESFQEKLMRFMLLLVGLPAVSCVWISTHASVKYWIGRSGFFIPLVVIVWVSFAQHLIMKSSVNRRCATIIVLVIPVASLMLVAHFHKVLSFEASTKLGMQDCINFPAKVHLQKAWETARDIRTKCVQEQAKLAGVTAEESQLMTPVQTCTEYEEGRLQWGTEWDYLETLEMEQRCAGWCFMGEPLWQNFARHISHDRCSIVASEMLGGTVYRTVRQLEIYCFWVLMLISVLFTRFLDL